jgi:hypothetical protein
MPSKKQRAKAAREARGESKAPPLLSTPPDFEGPGTSGAYMKETLLAKTREDRNRGDLLCIFWHMKMGEPSYMLDEDMSPWMGCDIASWNQAVKEGKIVFLSCNSIDRDKPQVIEGREFWPLNLQSTEEEEASSEPLSLLVFGYMCGGVTYWFPDRAKRNAIYEAIHK